MLPRDTAGWLRERRRGTPEEELTRDQRYGSGGQAHVGLTIAVGTHIMQTQPQKIRGEDHAEKKCTRGSRLDDTYNVSHELVHIPGQCDDGRLIAGLPAEYSLKHSVLSPFGRFALGIPAGQEFDLLLAEDPNVQEGGHVLHGRVGELFAGIHLARQLAGE